MHRLAAKAVDLMLILVVSAIMVYPLGVLLGLAYSLFADGMWRGQSAGKRLFGLTTVHLPSRSPAGYRESAIRNLPIAVFMTFSLIPIWGWILAIVLGLPMLALEAYLIAYEAPEGKPEPKRFSVPKNARLGDVLGDTRVVASRDAQF